MLFRRCFHGPRFATIESSRKWPRPVQRLARRRDPRVHFIHCQFDWRIAILQEMHVPETGSCTSLLDMQALRPENGPPLPLAGDLRWAT